MPLTKWLETGWVDNMTVSPDKKTDEELLTAYKNGDGKAVDELMVRYAALVRARARRFFLWGGDTEDLLQEGMMGLYSAIVDYRAEEGKTFKNFAYLCVSRRLIDAVKKASSKKIPPQSMQVPDFLVDSFQSGLPDLDDEMILSDEWKEFRKKASALLSDFEYKIFNMYLDGMSGREICETIGKPQKSVENAIQRSKKKLQPLLEK
ncbi:MAG: sigma-70 family RNA polymerase sigma factor [Clostridiales bacterium]|nr:sigma-70 family RNA polymerase sigma factor [Clostridiales bacterium]